MGPAVARRQHDVAQAGFDTRSECICGILPRAAFFFHLQFHGNGSGAQTVDVVVVGTVALPLLVHGSLHVELVGDLVQNDIARLACGFPTGGLVFGAVEAVGVGFRGNFYNLVLPCFAVGCIAVQILEGVGPGFGSEVVIPGGFKRVAVCA